MNIKQVKKLVKRINEIGAVAVIVSRSYGLVGKPKVVKRGLAVHLGGGVFEFIAFKDIKDIRQSKREDVLEYR